MSKIEFTADFFGRCYVTTLPNLSTSLKPKDVATTFYTPRTKGWYAFIKGMEKELALKGDKHE
jgi:hypothetical protein